LGKFIDLTGQQFNRLKVIERTKNNKSNQIQWLCECNCKDKNKVIVTGNNLKSGNTQSCGCLNKELVSERSKKFNTYDLFGEYGIGYTLKGEPYYFDLDDFYKINNYCWYKDNDGYIVYKVLHHNAVQMHRLIMNCPDDMEVDHIYHKRHDNRKSELRIVTKSQNQMNKVLLSNNTSGVKGVYWNKKKEKWHAQITVNNKRINLGYFNILQEAADVRKQAEIEYFGEYNLKSS
jgi:hypothetical protein